jgi:hypothetical protein
MVTEFNRKELLFAIDGAIQAYVDAEGKKKIDNAAAIAKHQAEWVESNGPVWRDAAKEIASAVRRGKVVTRDMLPRDGRDTWYPPYELRYRSGTPVPVELRQLRDTLNVITGDKVTPTALRNLGVSPRALQAAFRQISLAKEKNAD